jgi:signal transduction histidine kinase
VLTTVVLFKADRNDHNVETGKLPVIFQMPFYLLIILIGIIFISESLVMFFLHSISPQSNLIEAMVDAALLVMIISPFLYFFLLNPLTLHMTKRQRAEEELRKSHNELEMRVKERTLELTEKNSQLGQEITERKRIEKEREKLILELKDALMKVKTLSGSLEEANESLTELNEKKSEFIVTISHELRTPMTSIKGAMDYITTKLPMISRNDKDTGDLMEFFGVIKKNADRLTRLVNDTLDLERIESGIVELHLNQINLITLIKEVIISLQSIASKRNTTFKLMADSEVLVFADEDRIRQVLINLVSNALNYSPVNAEVHITVTEADNIITVRIKDEGPGIPVGVQDKIFDKFFTVGEKHGTGLGLPICRGIIEAHKGEIKVSGNSGNTGSEIYFKLPKSGDEVKWVKESLL